MGHGGGMYCSTVNLFAPYRPSIYCSPPIGPLPLLLRSAVMPASKVINDCGFGSLSLVCVGESLL